MTADEARFERIYAAALAQAQADVTTSEHVLRGARVDFAQNLRLRGDDHDATASTANAIRHALGLPVVPY
jgi:hypothetical protein